MGFPGGSDGNEFACNAQDSGFIPGSGRSPGEGNGRSPGERNGYPLYYFCLENSMDGGAWWAIFHGVTKSDMTEWPTHTWLSGRMTATPGRVSTPRTRCFMDRFACVPLHSMVQIRPPSLPHQREEPGMTGMGIEVAGVKCREGRRSRLSGWQRSRWSDWLGKRVNVKYISIFAFIFF